MEFQGLFKLLGEICSFAFLTTESDEKIRTCLVLLWVILPGVRMEKNILVWQCCLFVNKDN